MIYDLDRVHISQRIYDTWMAYIPLAVRELPAGTRPSDISDEQLRVLPNGDAEIFVTVQGGSEIIMRVPAGEWKLPE